MGQYHSGSCKAGRNISPALQGKLSQGVIGLYVKFTVETRAFQSTD